MLQSHVIVLSVMLILSNAWEFHPGPRLMRHFCPHRPESTVCYNPETWGHCGQCVPDKLSQYVETARSCAGYMVTQLTLLEHEKFHTFLRYYEDWGQSDMHWEGPCDFSANRTLLLEFQSAVARSLVPSGIVLLDPLAVAVAPEPDTPKEDPCPSEGLCFRTAPVQQRQRTQRYLTWNDNHDGGFTLPNFHMTPSMKWEHEDFAPGLCLTLSTVPESAVCIWT